MASHPAQRRYLAESLVRLRRSTEPRRLVAAQRAARVDANPHQIEAVAFALARIRSGGCILADEVGLGKTIEAGLVVTQLLAEGARRVLVIAPKSLVGQWRDELRTLFELDAREGSLSEAGFSGPGVFLTNREAAGSERGRAALLSSEPFDLCIIDEAHEVFAGIYRRFDAAGSYDDEAPAAKMAGRVRDVLRASQTPVLLLTATPIQNNLAELWGLVQYVDPLGTLLGDLPTFREVFCDGTDRRVARGLEHELRGRLEGILKRTLRRQAQPFLERPFVSREARLFEYTRSDAERALLDDVTKYLLEPNVAAFHGRNRALLLLGFHRRMSSSSRALAASLRNVSERLRTGSTDESNDLDSVDAPTLNEIETDSRLELGDVAGERARVDSFIRRAEALENDDGRFRALLKAVDFVGARAKAGQGSNKLVIFTESLVTQDYLRESLVANGIVRDDEVTLFRGNNETSRGSQALERWLAEVPQPKSTLSRELALRLALVHEFKTRSRVFISTEAGAKGLNLQFCNTVVNWDLPWNPQRIEQRIGRCHRYGQAHDVTVINFLARGDEAQALTFEILSQKLELFGTVLSASDEVLHRTSGPGGEVLVSALGAEFEGELARIYERARSLEEVHAELRALRERVTEERRRFEDVRDRTVGLIERTFDDDVQRVLKRHHDAAQTALMEFDEELEHVVTGFLDAAKVSYRRNGSLLEVSANAALPDGWRDGGSIAIGSVAGRESLHLAHPLVGAAVSFARSEPLPKAIRLPAPSKAGHGRLRLVKATFDGFERVELLVPVLLASDGELVSSDAVHEWLAQPLESATPPVTRIADDVMDDAQAEALFVVQRDVDAAEHARFSSATQQLERFLDDRALVVRRRRTELERRLVEAERRRDTAVGSEARTSAERSVAEVTTAMESVDETLRQLDVRADQHYRQCLERLQARRYGPPSVSVLFDVDVVFR